MPFYTGRFDMLQDEEDMLAEFVQFIDKFHDIDGDGDTEFGFTFEDKTKTGLPTKPHYHFYLFSSYKHDTIRKYMSYTMNYPKNFASLKEQDYNDNKWRYYIFKQGNIVFSDMDTDQQLIQIQDSQAYQEKIQPTLNTFKDHMENYLSQLPRDKSYIPLYDWINTKNPLEKNYHENDTNITPIDDLLKYYIADHISEFNLPCRQTFNHWLVVYTKELCPDHTIHIVDSFYKNTIY